MLIRTLIILGLALTTACAPPSAIQAQMDEQFRAVAELESEVREARKMIARFKADATALETQIATNRKRLEVKVNPLERRPLKSTVIHSMNYSRWRCETCGKPMWIDFNITPHHVNEPQDHAAKLSDADLKTIADGLRMSD